MEKCYVFNIVRSFEYKDSPESVPDGASGIYRYRDKSGNIIYIGRGNTKERLRSPERKSWNIELVEYSLLKEREDMKKYEAFHINEYKA